MSPTKIPTGYKQTEIGVIPEDWDVKLVEQISDVKSGKRLPLGKSLIDTETAHPYIRVADMFQGGVSLDEIKYVPDDVYPAIQNYRIFKDDIFISVAGTLGIVGKISIELDGANLTENADRLTNIKCNRDYLLFVLMSSLIQNTIESERTIGAQPKLALTRIKKFQIPQPSNKTEQTAIATALSDADALITALEKLIAKKRAIKQGAMQELLTGKRRLPGFSGKWRTLNMAEDSILKARIGWQGLTTAEYLESGKYYLVTGTDLHNGKINWSSCYFVDERRYSQDRNIQLKQGDILLTKDGTIGKVGYVDALPGPATLNSGIFVIRPKNGGYNPFFFYYILTSRIFDNFLAKLQAGSTIVHLYQKDFVDFSFLAPEIPEQVAIVDVLSNMDVEIERLERELDKYKMLKQGMMQVLLTGKVRLI